MGGIGRGYVVPTGMDYAVAIPRAARRDLSFVELYLEGSTDRHRVADEANELGTLATVYGVGLVVHLPTGVDLASPHEQVQDGALVEMKAALDAAAQVDARRAVLRPTPHYGRAPPDAEARRNRLLASVRALDDYAADRGIRLCVRVPQASIDLRTGLARLFEETDVDVCLDTGLARLAGHDETDQATLLLERDDRISHVHLRDVRTGGRRSGGNARGSGEVDWSFSSVVGLTDGGERPDGGDRTDGDGPPERTGECRAGADGPGDDHRPGSGLEGSDAADPPMGGDPSPGGVEPRPSEATGRDRPTGPERQHGPEPAREGEGSGGTVRGLPFGAGDVDFDRLLDPVRLGWSGTVSLAVGTDDEGYLDESVGRLDRIL